MNKPEIIQNIFTDNAIVTFDIKADSISFPPIIVGAKSIADTMFSDFHKRFEQVASYYLTQNIPKITHNKISKLKWLVTLKERKKSLFRIGAGYYDWSFSCQEKQESRISKEKWRVEKLHIYIHNMLIFDKPNHDWLTHFQSHLPYPWVSQYSIIRKLHMDDKFLEICEYLNQSSTP